MEVVILLTIHPVEYVFPIKQKMYVLSVFNMITRINESKPLTKHISCECKCKFDGRKCNSNQKRNNEKCNRECKMCAKKIRNPSTCTYENGRYLERIISDSAIMYDEIIEETKTYPTNTVPTTTIIRNFNEKKVTCKIENTDILFIFLLITISLLIIVSIYCYIIKH